MQFCPRCGGLMLPKKSEGGYVLVCGSCGCIKKAEKLEEYKMIRQAEKEEEIPVIEEGAKPALPTTEIKCPKCGNNAAYWWLRQTRGADEPTTRFYRCTKCVKPGTLIAGDWKPIREFRPGDGVVGGTVKEVFRRWYEGPLVEIRACGLLPIELSPEHPVLVASGRCDEGNKIHLGPSRWKCASEISPSVRHRGGDYLIVPRIDSTSKPRKVYLSQFTNERGVLAAKSRSIPLTVDLNNDTAWLLGIYVAEGSCSDKHVHFSFGKHERKLIQKTYQLTHAMGYSPCKVDGLATTDVVVPSRLLARAFCDWCGSMAHKKRVPGFILYHQDNRILSSFLSGYFSGDGYIGNGRLYASTASLVLALQLQLMCARLSEFLHVCPKRIKGDEVIQGRRVHVHDSYTLFAHLGHGINKRARFLDDCIATPVTSVKLKPYIGWLYNLRTSGDTYLVNNALVHNCGHTWREYT